MSLFTNFFGQQREEQQAPAHYTNFPPPNTNVYGAPPVGQYYAQEQYSRLPRMLADRSPRAGFPQHMQPVVVGVPVRPIIQGAIQDNSCDTGSMCERKEAVIVPVLSLEGSKGSQMNMGSYNSQGSKLSHNFSKQGIGSTTSDKPFSQPSDRIRPINAGTRSVLEQDLTQMSLKLIKYIRLNDEEKSSKIINRKLANLNYKGENDWTPLHFACWFGNAKIVNLLLLNKAEIDIKAKNGLTSLMVVCKTGNLHIFNTLIAAGANYEEVDSNGSTCLHYAAQGGSREIITELLNLNVPAEKKNDQGKFPEDCATDIRLNAFLKEKRESKEGFFVPIFTYTFDKIKNIFSSDEQGQRVQGPSKVWPNDFEILCLLGRGSFGQVFLVRKKDTGVKYAMKVLLKAKVLSQNLLKYAMTERKVLSVVNHPFIVGLHFAFQTSDKLCLILDYCSGGDLSKHLKLEKRFTEQKTKWYICEILLALQELHRRDIIYRDLKPDNIVLDSQGHCKLTDFGLSKEGVMEHTSGARSFCGSIAYLAPEMLKKTGHGKAVDWYLLGVVFYEMLTGQPPYYAPTKEELFYNIERGQLRVPAGISKDAINLMTGLLERNPEARLGSGPSDAEEIKAHPFFRDINWDIVIDRRLPVSPPCFEIEEFATPVDSTALFNEDGFTMGNGEVNGSNIPGWSFAKK